MKREGYDISHSSIHHGIAETTKKIEADPDYSTIINEIDQAMILNLEWN